MSGQKNGGGGVSGDKTKERKIIILKKIKVPRQQKSSGGKVSEREGNRGVLKLQLGCFHLSHLRCFKSIQIDWSALIGSHFTGPQDK